MSTPPATPGSPGAPTRRFAALHVRPYRNFFAANLLSMTADNIEHVISYWVIFQAFHSPALAGFAVISHWVPFLLFSLYAGALADRYDCRRLIQISQGLFMLASFAWGILFLTGTLQMWHAIVILLVHGAAGVIASPASQLIIHDMVEHEELTSAIRLTATSRYLAILLGPAVGGAMLLLLGPALGLLVNVAVYVPFTVFVGRAPYTGHSHRGGRVRASGFRDMLGTFRQARLEPSITTMVVLAGAASFFVGNAFQAQMPAYAQLLGTDESGSRYTVLLAANAAGAILGMLLLEGMHVLRLSVRTAIVSAGLWGVAMGLFPATDNYPLAVVLLVAAGVFSITYTSMAQTLVQVLAPVDVRGSVVGLFNTAMLGLRAGSGFTIGIVGTFVGIRLSLEVSSLMVVATALVLFARDARVRKGSAAGALGERASALAADSNR